MITQNLDKKLFSVYYRSHVQKEYAWFVVGGLKGFEYLSFDRTVDVNNSIFEFFVSPDLEDVFLEVIHYFEQKGFITCLEKKENRLLFEDV
jgi:hypothetical protein